MGDIVIIGGGFAGLEAARLLSKNHGKLGGRRILLVDSKETFDFLPLLPDVAGGCIRKDSAVLRLTDHLAGLNVNFEHGEVVKIDAASREVFLASGETLGYEFLLVCCGSLTNFYGLEDVRKHSLKLDCVEDAVVLNNIVNTYPSRQIIIAGGGYTGVELASHLAILLRRRKARNYRIAIVEKQQEILGSLPEWVRDYCRINLCALRVDIFCGCSLREFSDRRLKLSNGLEFENYLLIWTAGVQTPAFIREGEFGRNSQGRLVVDSHMRFAPSCFAAGDVVCYNYKGKSLRMAVQFSIAQAGVAARNIIRLAAGKKRLVRYRPLGLELLVPLANRKACGTVLGIRVWGVLGWFLAIMVCISRSLTLKNRFGIARDAFLKIR